MPYHMADKVNDQGGVSALCYKRPRAINLRKASWTNRPIAVTCPDCKALLKKASEKEFLRGGDDHAGDVGVQ